MKVLASQIKPGDTVTYCGMTFLAHEVSKRSVTGLLRVDVTGSYPQYIAPEREVEVKRPQPVEKPFVVLTRDYDAKGKKDVRRFTFASEAKQAAFLRNTNRCVTFFTN